ncbi:MAG: SAM-dependent methyltransferase [Planctomycetaceae bacterium]
MTADGTVRAKQQHKFRQINRYLEFIDDVLPDLPPEGPLSIVDCGCGKSGLTFALHHHLTVNHGREVRAVGLDRESQVIDRCRNLSRRLELSGLTFLQGDIADYQPAGRVDMVVSLHACDTATDAALAQAVRWEADVILAVPCCQHEVAPQLTANALAGLLRFGLLKERFAADITDALRANLLEAVGYKSQIVEFIELEHTPKNLLIRAVKRRLRNHRPAACPHEVDRTIRTTQTNGGHHHVALERALGDRLPSMNG